MWFGKSKNYATVSSGGMGRGTKERECLFCLNVFKGPVAGETENSETGVSSLDEL